MDFHKTEDIKNHDQLKELISQYKDFISTGEGKPPRFINEFNHLIYTNQGGGHSVKQYTWIGQTEKEIEYEEKQLQDEIDLIESYKTDIEKWRSVIIKPWSLQKLHEWIDITYSRPLEYNLTPEQITEREAKRLEILEYHNQTVYVKNPVKPEAPSWVLPPQQ